MDTRELTTFLAVADSLSFTRAAELLHLSVSAVSRTVQRLEEEVGQALLLRDKRQVHLTRAGREFRDYARQSIAEWQALQLRLGSDQALSGQVSLYCSVTASHSVLAPILEAFRREHPAVEVVLHTGDQADGIDRVLGGLDDIAVTGRPDTLPSGLSFLPLLESPMQFCVPAAPCAVREMAYEEHVDWSVVPFIVPERGITRGWLEQWFQARGIRPRIYAQVAGHEAIVAMVGLGLGIGVAPELVVDASGLTQRVDFLPVSTRLPPLVVGLCSASTAAASPLIQSFRRVAGQTYGTTV